jgi:hypothetical protein
LYAVASGHGSSLSRGAWIWVLTEYGASREEGLDRVDEAIREGRLVAADTGTPPRPLSSARRAFSRSSARAVGSSFRSPQRTTFAGSSRRAASRAASVKPWSSSSRLRIGSSGSRGTPGRERATCSNAPRRLSRIAAIT